MRRLAWVLTVLSVVAAVEEWCRHGDQPEWEDLPMLGEHAFQRLCDAIVKVGEMCGVWAKGADDVLDVDSSTLLLRARDDSPYSGSFEADRRAFEAGS